MRVIQANIEAILMDRIPDNCTIDCPFCVPRLLCDGELPYCTVLNEFVEDYDDTIHDDCTLMWDPTDDDEEEVKKE